MSEHTAEKDAEHCPRCGLPLAAHPSECPWNPPTRTRVIPPGKSAETRSRK